jgi:hypothetical protein
MAKENVSSGTLFSHKNGIMSLAAMWMELELILSNMNQAQKVKYHMFLLICGI